MARTVVFIFLLDTFPELPVHINQTVQETFSKLSGSPNQLQECNPSSAFSVLQKANLERSKNNSNWKLFKTTEDSIEEFKKLRSENYNKKLDIANFLSDSFENSVENYRDYYEQNDIDDYDMPQKYQEEMNNNFWISSKNPPFLVAIFETLSNVTAQTCAGSVLSAHWVVTAASCVGVLREFYGNVTNDTEKSRYTIVAGSTNPFIDGSSHNVTDILLRPPSINEEQKNILPKLAMMKVVPGLAVEKINIVEDKEDTSDATIYGWTMTDSKYDAMLPTSISAKKMPSSQCQPHSSEFISSSTLCFNPKTMTLTNSTKLGVGGPVLVQKRMLGVVLDDRVPLLVTPLTAHAWIQKILNEDYL